jgi:hypothetical protein
MKKQKLTIYDLGKIPVTETKRDPSAGETLRQYLQRIAREEKQAADQQAVAIDTLSAAGDRAKQECLAMSAEMTTRFWTQELETLPAQIHDPAAYEELFLEKSDEPVDANSIYDIVKAFLHTPPTDILSENSQRRFGLFCAAQVNSGVKIDPESLRVIFNRMMSLGIFKGETTFQERTPEPTVREDVPPAEPTLDELLATTSSETREGRRILREAVHKAAVYGEYRETWAAFTDSLYRNFEGFVLSDSQEKTFYDTMVRRGMNFHRPADYDRVRISLVSSSDLPSHLLYPNERLELDMENADLNDRNVRREFARRSRALAQ